MKKFLGFEKGINLGGWLSQCRDHYNEEHYRTFITEEDIEIIAKKGYDHVRLPIDYNVIQTDDGKLIEEGFVHIDNGIKWAHERGMNIVIDLHKTCGYVFDDETYTSFFTNERLQEQFIFLWEELTKRYGSYEYVAFELLNEITAPEMAKPWNEIIKKTVPVIRKISKTVPIIVGGIYNSSIDGLKLMEAPCDENMVYTFHCYSPFIFTHQAAYWVKKMPSDFRTTYPKTAAQTKEESHIAFDHDFDGEFDQLSAELLNEKLDHRYFLKMFEAAVEIANQYEVPLYCGEYGVIELADEESTKRWFIDIHKALEEAGIARCSWTYKEMDFSGTFLLS